MKHFKTIEIKLKKQGYHFIAGLDEVGRGPFAGPIVAAAVILPSDFERPKNLDDSKKLSHSNRKKLYEFITNTTFYGIGLTSDQELDQFGLIKGTNLAFQRAIDNLPNKPDFLLIDGKDNFSFKIRSQSFIKGDESIQSIACASIIAKVVRDQIMTVYGKEFPEYGFDKHKGYGTSMHRIALKKYGLCRIHRRSFKPIATLIHAK